LTSRTFFKGEAPWVEEYRRKNTGERIQNTGDRIKNAGDRIKNTGDRIQETEYRSQKPEGRHATDLDSRVRGNGGKRGRGRSSELPQARS
jgi:hypothetical protein